MTAKRFDDGKSPVVEGCFHYFPAALLAVGMVSKFGSDKYEVPLAEKNWLGLEQARIVNSEGRHLLKEAIEGAYDSESNLLHKAHKAWNALADLEKELAKGTPLEEPSELETAQQAIDVAKEVCKHDLRIDNPVGLTRRPCKAHNMMTCPQCRWRWGYPHEIFADNPRTNPPPAEKGVGAKQDWKEKQEQATATAREQWLAEQRKAAKSDPMHGNLVCTNCGEPFSYYFKLECLG
jgi:hypothetical protein